MGCAFTGAYTSGVAGLHRLFEPLLLLAGRAGKTLIIVWRHGRCVPSVRGWLVDVPFIGAADIDRATARPGGLGPR